MGMILVGLSLRIEIGRGQQDEVQEERSLNGRGSFV